MRWSAVRAFVLGVLAWNLPTQAVAQDEPSASDSALVRFDNAPSPRGALVRALALPGWGQVYAGRPERTPVVVAVVGGLAGLSVYFNGRYLAYRNAFRYIEREDADPTVPDADNEFADLFEDWVATGSRSAPATRALRDDFRRNRDLAVLGTTLAYALQALDAYVAAELTGFDVSEDLSLRVVPTRDGPATVLTLRF